MFMHEKKKLIVSEVGLLGVQMGNETHYPLCVMRHTSFISDICDISLTTIVCVMRLITQYAF